MILVVVLGLAAGAFFLLKPGGGTHRAAHPPASAQPSQGHSQGASQAPPTTTPSTPGAPSSTPSGSAQQPPPAFTKVAAACTTPDKATFARLVPGQQTLQSVQQVDVPTCIASDPQGTSSLVVQTRLVVPGHVPDPIGAARGFYAADLAAARQGNGYDETLSVAAEPGVGDEAFHWAKLDKGAPPVVVGQVEVRTRNGVIVITYSQNPRPGESDMAAGNRLVTDAIRVARQVLSAYS